MNLHRSFILVTLTACGALVAANCSSDDGGGLPPGETGTGGSSAEGGVDAPKDVHVDAPSDGDAKVAEAGDAHHDADATADADASQVADADADVSDAAHETDDANRSAACQSLHDCCPTLGANEANCANVANAGPDATCNDWLGFYCADGGAPTGGCSTLATCCGTLTGATHDLCQTIAKQNNETQCNAYETANCGDAGDGGEAGLAAECTALASCCSGLDDGTKPTCEGLISQNFGPGCAAFENAFCGD